MLLSRHSADPIDPFTRLLDTLHYDSKLYLVFEFLDNDLKKYQEAMNAAHTPLNMQLIKVRASVGASQCVSYASLSIISEIYVAAVFWFSFLPLSSYHPP